MKYSYQVSRSIDWHIKSCNQIFSSFFSYKASGEDIAYKIEKMHQHINKTGDYLRYGSICENQL